MWGKTIEATGREPRGHVCGVWGEETRERESSSHSKCKLNRVYFVFPLGELPLHSTTEEISLWDPKRLLQRLKTQIQIPKDVIVCFHSMLSFKAKICVYQNYFQRNNCLFGEFFKLPFALETGSKVFHEQKCSQYRKSGPWKLEGSEFITKIFRTSAFFCVWDANISKHVLFIIHFRNSMPDLIYYLMFMKPLKTTRWGDGSGEGKPWCFKCARLVFHLFSEIQFNLIPSNSMQFILIFKCFLRARYQTLGIY